MAIDWLGINNDKLKYNPQAYNPYFAPNSPAQPNIQADSGGGGAAAAMDPTGMSQLASAGTGLVDRALATYGAYEERKRADEKERYNRSIAGSQFAQNKQDRDRAMQTDDAHKKWTESFLRALAYGKRA